MRIGMGYDLHRLVEGRPLVLGGVRIPFEKGLSGHSDADALAHAIIDALLGAAALGNIGRMFPDSDPQFKDADSLQLLEQAVKAVGERGYAVVNVDVLERRFPAGSEVTPELLRELRVVKGRLSRLKILGRGELSKPLMVRAHHFTTEAKEKIERAGGKAEVVS